MEFSAEQIAELLGGEIEGNSKATVSQLAKIEEGKKVRVLKSSGEKY